MKLKLGDKVYELDKLSNFELRQLVSKLKKMELRIKTQKRKDQRELRDTTAKYSEAMRKIELDEITEDDRARLDAEGYTLHSSTEALSTIITAHNGRLKFISSALSSIKTIEANRKHSRRAADIDKDIDISFELDAEETKTARSGAQTPSKTSSAAKRRKILESNDDDDSDASPTVPVPVRSRNKAGSAFKNISDEQIDLEEQMKRFSEELDDGMAVSEGDSDAGSVRGGIDVVDGEENTLVAFMCTEATGSRVKILKKGLSRLKSLTYEILDYVGKAEFDIKFFELYPEQVRIQGHQFFNAYDAIKKKSQRHNSIFENFRTLYRSSDFVCAYADAFVAAVKKGEQPPEFEVEAAKVFSPLRRGTGAGAGKPTYLEKLKWLFAEL